MKTSFTPHITVKMLNLNIRNSYCAVETPAESYMAFWLHLADDAGWGEGAVAESSGEVNHGEWITYWHRAAQPGTPYPQDAEEIEGWIDPLGRPAARSALNMALYDFIGRSTARPVYQLLGVSAPQPMPTLVTIAGEADAVLESAKNTTVAQIKLPLCGKDDDLRLKALRQARPNAELWVECDPTWNAETCAAQLKPLAQFELAGAICHALPGMDAALGALQTVMTCQLMVSGAVQKTADIEALAKSGVKGVCLKLAEVGGLSRARDLAQSAHHFGMRVMLGCLPETSLGVTAALHLASLADWLDLDAPLRLTNDPFIGAQFSADGIMSLPNQSGLGVTLKTPRK